MTHIYKNALRRLANIFYQVPLQVDKFVASTVNSQLQFLADHSTSTLTKHADMRIRLLPALQDNYMYLLIDEATNECAVVDPVEPDKVIGAIAEEGVKLTKVITTHHHWDHAGGNEKFIEKVGKMEVIGGDDRIGALTTKVGHGDQFMVGNLNVRCLFTPCHTTGHICYFVTGPSGQDPAVFTGDTLFVGGCGKFFEGTGEHMYTALIDILSKLPLETKVYCGHEYTVNNLKFAKHCEPNNEDVSAKLQATQKQRANNEPTVPSSIGDEMKFNPFMRVTKKSIAELTGESDPRRSMGALRNMKDRFKA